MRIAVVIVALAFGTSFVHALGSEAEPGAADQFIPPPTANAPTFNKDVAPILYKNCVTCHRPGEIAPMSLLSYRDARRWARAIRDNVANRVMPPWHADPAHGSFANDRSLSAEDRNTIVRWVATGTLEGDAADLPPLPTFTEGWQLGEPDAVFSLPVEYTVPADGFVEYEYFEVPTNFAEDKWLSAFEVRPGNPEVVHHVLVYMRPAEPERRPAGFNLAQGMDLPDAGPNVAGRLTGQSLFPRPERIGQLVGGFAPGYSYFELNPGSAVLVRAGSTLVIQMHYTSKGADATDRTSIGMHFADRPPTTEIRMGTLLNGQFKIPAGAADHVVTAEMTMTEDVTMRSLLPHTHLRGKSWQYIAIYPDGRSEIILNVPGYDFNWQTDYVFAEPLKLPKGTTLRAVAHYDNSADNPANPDPTVDVGWGEQTWEEMMFSSFTYSIDGAVPGATTPPPADRASRD